MNVNDAKKSNESWFAAVEEAASVMIERRAKYTGRSTDPYQNFIYIADSLNLTMDDVFRFFLAIKLSRLDVGSAEDKFADEKILDTLIDLGNYAFLWAGWKIRTKDVELPE